MGGVSKPLIKLGKKTLFEMVLDAFLASSVESIVVVCPEDDSRLRELAPTDAGKSISFVRGGETRSDSVFLGVRATPGSAGKVCVHDCARPFVTAETIDSVISEAEEWGSASACSRVTDTIRFVDEEKHEVYTPDRGKLLSVMTPQCFGKKEYLSAFALAKMKKKSFTDDCGMLEDAGIRTKYVLCPSDNIKLTDAGDIELARAIRLLREHKQKKEGDPE